MFSSPLFFFWSSVYHQPLRVDHNRGRAVWNCMKLWTPVHIMCGTHVPACPRKAINQHSRQQLCPRETFVTSQGGCPGTPSGLWPWATLSCLWRKRVPSEVPKVLGRWRRLRVGVEVWDKGERMGCDEGTWLTSRSVRLILDIQISADWVSVPTFDDLQFYQYWAEQLQGILLSVMCSARC